jgi:phage shock protein C
MNNDYKRLQRSLSNRQLGGVCAGLAQYFNLDPNAVRAVYAIGTLFTGIWPGVFLYAAMWFFLPVADNTEAEYERFARRLGRDEPRTVNVPYEKRKRDLDDTY